MTKEKESGVLELMDWPNQSPDLNPIKQIWDLVDSKIDHTEVSSTASLWEQLETIWNSVTKETVETYIKTVPARMQAVIKANRGRTNYYFFLFVWFYWWIRTI